MILGRYSFMRDGGDRANIFADHTRDVAGRVHRNGIKIADEIDRLWANRHARATIDTGVPANLKKNGFIFCHKN